MLILWSSAADTTVDWFENRYLSHTKNTKWLRFNTELFPNSLTIDINGERSVVNSTSDTWYSDEVTAIWYRRPGKANLVTNLPSEAKSFIESESDKMLWLLQGELSHAKWMNIPENNRIAANKLHQLRIASEKGFRCPKTLVTNNPNSVLQFAETSGGKLICKPLHRGTITFEDSIKVFYSTLLTIEQLKTGRASIALSPLIYQEYIEKAFELRATVVGQQVFTVRLLSQERSDTKIDWRRNAYDLKYEIYELPDKIKDKCISITKQSGLLFSAFDLIVTPEDEYVFLEHNPNGQFAWIEDRTGMPIGRALLHELSTI